MVQVAITWWHEWEVAIDAIFMFTVVGALIMAPLIWLMNRKK